MDKNLEATAVLDETEDADYDTCFGMVSQR